MAQSLFHQETRYLGRPLCNTEIAIPAAVSTVPVNCSTSLTPFPISFFSSIYILRQSLWYQSPLDSLYMYIGSSVGSAGEASRHHCVLLLLQSLRGTIVCSTLYVGCTPSLPDNPAAVTFHAGFHMLMSVFILCNFCYCLGHFCRGSAGWWRRSARNEFPRYICRLSCHLSAYAGQMIDSQNGTTLKLITPGVGKVVDIDPWGSRTELKGSINLWGSEGGRLRIYIVEAGFSLANAILTEQRNRLNLENCGDLRLKLTNFKPNINSLAAAHQAHPSH
ncbi:hypothetical protein FHG87_006287 [Trinorchestia longiramus]|nr:hypothetical protein FHG87_006287 [Trinorchestia longiramus]